VRRSIFRFLCVLLVVLAVAWACPFDETLRAYLDAHFWLPFSKHHWDFEKKNVRRISRPYAGMVKAQDTTPLARLRAAYQAISQPSSGQFDAAPLREAAAAARADPSLVRRDWEEVDLIDAKIDMRLGEANDPDPLQSAQVKIEKFLRTGRTPEFLSEARGWLAYIHYLRGEQKAAGKIYLDELNRNGSNLSRETLLNSLQLNYGYDGGPQLLEDLDQYFDTPEHAAFAIQLVTNPHQDSDERRYDQGDGVDRRSQTYARIRALLERHNDLLKSNTRADTLALLSMRTALRMGDPPAAMNIAAMIPGDASIRSEPDFNWMLASARFLSREYASAEEPLLAIFNSSQSSGDQQAAAAYGLCGVYQKIKRPTEQIRFALFLHTAARKNNETFAALSGVADGSVYWAVSGWDLGLLLDSEAPTAALESFLAQYPDMPDIRIVKYSLAVRLTRANRYEEAARIYQAIQAQRRAPRMRQLAALFQEANRTDVSTQQILESKYKMAVFLAAHENGIYFNDAVWERLQRYALTAPSDNRLTREEHQNLIDGERRLRDDQEELWRAYMILRDVVRDAGHTDLGRQSAQLAVRCLRKLSERFGRQEEVRKADVELSAWLRQ
jgi:hypothetical protein